MYKALLNNLHMPELKCLPVQMQAGKSIQMKTLAKRILTVFFFSKGPHSMQIRPI